MSNLFQAALYAALLTMLLTAGMHAEPLQPIVPIPRGYERAVSKLPPGHWSLVRHAVIDRTSSGQSRREDMSIHLTPHKGDRSYDRQLWHEVAHMFHYTYPIIEHMWATQFWEGDKLIGFPVTDYARTNYREDFAETYERMIQDGTVRDIERKQFMQRYVLVEVY